MRSIRTRLFMLISSMIIGIFILVAGVSVYEVHKVIRQEAESSMDFMMRVKTGELDRGLKNVETSVSQMRKYIEDNINVSRLTEDLFYMNNFMDRLSNYLKGLAEVAGNVESVYFRLNPDVYEGEAGVFLTYNGYDDYINAKLTDLTAYGQNDTEHVGWYYEAVRKGGAVWLEPYVNRNINSYMITYSSPVYVEGRLLGVVGMDINMSVLHNVVDSVNYADGFGFLVGKEQNVIYHKDYPDGLKTVLMDDELKSVEYYLTPNGAKESGSCLYKWHGRKYRLMTDALVNDMVFAISVPQEELMRPLMEEWKILVIILVLVLLFTVMAIWSVMVWIIRPIRELTDASSRIARGELNVEITYESKDEIGNLAGSIRMMSKEIREYITYIHGQAYTDAMTGVGNKTAYLDIVRRLDKKISEKMADFVVAVFDVNGLKHVNDNLGHEYGDMLITDAAAALKSIFGAEYVYRIGGDEFIVVLENVTRQQMEEALGRFDEALASFNQENTRYDVNLSVSKGAAGYEEGEDTEYKEVFKRADERMYQDKDAYYKGRNDRRK